MTDELLFLQVSEIKEKMRALTFLSQQLTQQGYVTEGFTDAIIAREAVFPTGLQFEDYGVAIPHTDSDYVRETKIAIMTLKEPVPFIQMTTENQTVEVRVIIMLAIKDAHTQLDMLQRIIGFLQDPETVSTLLSYSAEQKEDVLQLLSHFHII
ncbi:PTS sugar transporter subunit IIA [Streptococcus iniae]